MQLAVQHSPDHAGDSEISVTCDTGIKPTADLRVDISDHLAFGHDGLQSQSLVVAANRYTNGSFYGIVVLNMCNKMFNRTVK